MRIPMGQTNAWHGNLRMRMRQQQKTRPVKSAKSHWCFGTENMTKAWHDKGMEWHDKAWRGCDKLLQHQITETGKIKKKPPMVQNRTWHQRISTPVPINSMLKTDVSKINANIEIWGLGAGMGLVSSSAMCFHVIRPWRCHPGKIGGGFFLILPVPRLGCYMATQHMKNDRYTHARQRQTCTHTHTRTH